jgi:hypothetical protein
VADVIVGPSRAAAGTASDRIALTVLRLEEREPQGAGQRPWGSWTGHGSCLRDVPNRATKLISSYRRGELQIGNELRTFSGTTAPM